MNRGARVSRCVSSLALLAACGDNAPECRELVADFFPSIEAPAGIVRWRALDGEPTPISQQEVGPGTIGLVSRARDRVVVQDGDRRSIRNLIDGSDTAVDLTGFDRVFELDPFGILGRTFGVGLRRLSDDGALSTLSEELGRADVRFIETAPDLSRIVVTHRKPPEPFATDQIPIEGGALAPYGPGGDGTCPGDIQCRFFGFASDGTALFAIGNLLLLAPTSGTPLVELQRLDSPILGATWSPLGSRILVRQGTFDRPRAMIVTRDGSLTELAFDPDGWSDDGELVRVSVDLASRLDTVEVTPIDVGLPLVLASPRRVGLQRVVSVKRCD